jgi:c(7)-type cytochrome triheme protein
MKKKLIFPAVLMMTLGIAGFGLCGAVADDVGVVVYEAKNGDVTFDHGAHSEMIDCAKCHQEDPPEKIEITRETAHAEACVDCHKEMEAGPVKCAECHVR